MGLWDELCLICGLSLGGGPGSMFADGGLEHCLDAIMESLEKQGLSLDISQDQLRDELRRILLLFQFDDYEIPTPYEEAVKSGSISSVSYFPFPSEEWDGWKAIAIGVFDDSFSDPDGIIITRLVCYPSGCGGLFEGIEGQTGMIQTEAGVDSGGMFCLRTPYHYLRYWVDRDSLPPRQTAFPLEPDMSFESEFYEIVRFWDAGDDSGILSGISYGGIERCLEQFHDHFSTGFGRASELGRALEAGTRGNDLIPALLNDFNVWQTCPPDSGTTITGPLGVLPDEVIFEILLNIPIDSILSFTSTCKSLRHHFGREVNRFCTACNDSKPSQAESANSSPIDVSAIFNAEFPLVEFFRTNYRTDSMRNRRRLWKISQHFREEWYQYR
ncbi:15292_t:CDS:2, partial [Acaulospora colombiana]